MTLMCEKATNNATNQQKNNKKHFRL